MSGENDSNDDGFTGFLREGAGQLAVGLFVIALVTLIGFYFYIKPPSSSKEVEVQIVETSLPSVAKRVADVHGDALDEAGIVGIEPIYYKGGFSDGSMKDYRVLVAGAERVESIALGVLFCTPSRYNENSPYVMYTVPTAPVDGRCPQDPKSLVRSDTHVSMAKIAGAWTVQVAEQVPAFVEATSEDAEPSADAIADSERLESLDASYQDAKNLIEFALIKAAEHKALKADWATYLKTETEGANLTKGEAK
jgi:hypothetical protein